jgi:MFS family permease
MAAYFAFVPLYAPRLGLEGSRFVFLTFSAVVLLVRSFGARIPDLVGARRSSTGALVFGAAGMIVLAVWSSPVGLFAGTVVFAMGMALAFPALTVLTVNRVRASERGAVLGTFTMSVEVAFGLGPPTAGLFIAVSGFRAAFFAAAVVAGLGLVILSRTSMGLSKATNGASQE